MYSDSFNEKMWQAHERYKHIRIGGVDALDTLTQIVAAADSAGPDDEDFVYIGVGLIEPLLDRCAGGAVDDAFEAALREHENLRRAYRSAAIESDELAARLARIVPPDDANDSAG